MVADEKLPLPVLNSRIVKGTGGKRRVFCLWGKKVEEQGENEEEGDK